MEIRRDGDRVIITCADGKLDEDDEKELTEEFLQKTEESFFPDREVGPGDDWTVDVKSIRAFLKDVEKAEVKCQFKDVVIRAGQKCAHIRVEMGFVAKPEGAPFAIKAHLAGDLYHVISLQRTMAVEITGPITIEGKVEQNGVEVSFAGKGQMDFKRSAEWQKVAGDQLPNGK